MGWSAGTFSRVHDWTSDAASDIDIEAARMDQEDDNFETGIDTCLTKDGQNSPTADLPMGGNKHTNVGAATALNQYARVSELIDQDHVYYVDSGSANTYVITPSPAISAYEEGQRFVFRATNANTGASTLNVNSQGAIAIQTVAGDALVGGEILSGAYYEVIYDANTTPDRWVLLSPSSSTGSFTGTWDDLSGTPTDTIDYTLNGDLVTLSVPQKNGTSTSSSNRISGIPVNLRPPGNWNFAPIPWGTDNGTSSFGGVFARVSGSQILLYDRSGNSNSWTPSGDKANAGFTITYSRAL